MAVAEWEKIMRVECARVDLTSRRRNALIAAAASAILVSGSIGRAQTSGSWVVDADGSWSQAGNWSPAIPDGGGTATFFSLPVFTTAPRTIFQDQANVTLGGIVYDTPF